jgi:hypothetical protein
MKKIILSHRRGFLCRGFLYRGFLCRGFLCRGFLFAPFRKAALVGKVITISLLLIVGLSIPNTCQSQWWSSSPRGLDSNTLIHWADTNLVSTKAYADNKAAVKLNASDTARIAFLNKNNKYDGYQQINAIYNTDAATRAAIKFLGTAQDTIGFYTNSLLRMSIDTAGNVILAKDLFLSSIQKIYLAGNATLSGSWRISATLSGNLVFEYYNGAAWVEKSAIVP